MSRLNVPDPMLAPLRELLVELVAGDLAALGKIEVEVRRLVLVAFVAGNERGIAYVISMDKSDEGIAGEEVEVGEAGTDGEAESKPVQDS